LPDAGLIRAFAGIGQGRLIGLRRLVRLIRLRRLIRLGRLIRLIWLVGVLVGLILTPATVSRKAIGAAKADSLQISQICNDRVQGLVFGLPSHERPPAKSVQAFSGIQRPFRTY
jgi:hypothetical protein